MAEAQLKVDVRQEIGKGAARRLRRSGYIPGVIYGPGKQATSVSATERDLVKVFQAAGHTHLVDLDVAGEKRTVLIKEVETNPVKGELIHVDFYEVRMDKAIHTAVPIVLTGEEARENDGGIVTQSLREMEVTCLPNAIPDHIEVSVSGLAVGDSIHVADLALPEGVESNTDGEEIVVSITLPTAAPVDEEADEVGADEEVPLVGETPDEEE